MSKAAVTDYDSVDDAQRQQPEYIPPAQTRCQIIAQNIAAVLLLLGSIAVLICFVVWLTHSPAAE